MSVDLDSPSPWQVRLLGDVADITLGGTPATEVAGFWGGNIPWMSSGEVNKKHVFEVDGRITEAGLAASNATLVDPPTVAIGLAGQGKTRGTAALVHIRVCTNQSIALIKGKSGTLDTPFLFHNLDRRYEELRSRSAGGGRAGLSREILQTIPIDFPGLPEQQRIAKALDTADEAIAKTEAAIAKLKQVRAGLLHDLLTRGLDEHGQLRDPIAHPEQFQDPPLGHIPREWEIATLVSRISLPQGQVDPRALPYSEWLLVAPDHIESETGRLIARQTAAEQGAISGKYVFEPGDVVYSKIRPYLRKAILASDQGLCSADMYPLRPNPGVNSRFLLAAILGESFSRFASAVSMRSGFPKLNRDELAEFVMGWPKPDEQNRIAAVLTALDQEQTAVERELAKLHQLKSGLMTDLLTGRVRAQESVLSEEG